MAGNLFIQYEQALLSVYGKDIRHNLFTGKDEFKGRPIDDRVMLKLFRDLRVKHGYKWSYYSASQFKQAISSVALLREYNPVTEYLDSLKWDGKKRLENLLIDVFNITPANKEEAAYIRAVTKMFFIGAVERARAADKLPGNGVT